MKAVAVPQFKGIPQVMELPKPQVKPGTILVRVAAAGINPFDWKLIDGILDGKMPHNFPMVLGVDGAGTVEAIGEGVTHFKQGDKIYGQFIHSPIGEGSYAEYVVVPEKAAISHAPTTISLVEAAAMPTAGMTALQLLERLGLKHEQTLLLVGATGGVGSFIVQLAHMQGIYVIATVSDEDGAERMKKLGAKETINYKKVSVEKEIKANYPSGVEGLIDLVSAGPVFKTMTSLVKVGGAALTTAFVADKEALKARNITGGNFETQGTPASLDTLADAVDSGALKVPVGMVISMEEVPEAIEASRKLKGKGKTVIKIG
ncbi:NADP-dependent oxidoreductase [Chitinophaga ginsengisoli]|uniref:NADPH:quinone reductase-like Zn-dependent oxidoreductase n=1 Tax=Chitinophaga ginsengisoli TaxID=363837 RepID=A0A2P8G117_9BACT|nr:NADP-dependent oxidoreductase [Chitinophaga ginsengisoli]PSL27667.1 NADPH:quinone reductase-like Zn-dependent oxidoreductase [Chitinophaga ginsengisoli]